jgi:hypothetical protein
VKINTLNLLSCAAVLLTGFSAYANPVLITGTPGDANLAVPTRPSPTLGNLINFDNVLTCTSTACPSLTVLNATFSSPDGVLVIPFSTQSFPNELFDNSANGSANLSIQLIGGVTEIGVGIADSDPVTVTLQALNSSGTPFGNAFAVTIPENTVNPGNGYYVVSDTTPDIFGLLVTQPVGSANFSGLAIDDVQSTPEPSTFLLLASGAALFAGLRLRKRA